MKRSKKLNAFGFAHVAALAVVVIGIAVVGTYMLVASHADSPNPPDVSSSDVAHRAKDRLDKMPGFAGIEIADDGTINVYSKDTSSNFKKAAVENDTSAKFVFHQTKHDAQEYSKVQDQVSADSDYLQSQGITPVSVAADPLTDTVKFSIVSPTPAQVQLLKKRYGELIDIVPGEKRYIRASRLTDSPAWNSGDIVSFNAASCTSGPAVKRASDGLTMLLTAGHCYIGDAIASGSFTTYKYPVYQKNSMSPYGTNATLIGYAAAKFTQGGYDIALINVRPSGLIWRTAQLTTISTTRGPQVAAQGSIMGELLCVSGAYSGERCNAKVITINSTMWTCGENYCAQHPHVSIAKNIGGAVLAGAGDSGAAVYSVHTNGLYVKGMYVAGPGGQNCVYYNTGGRYGTCSNEIDYEEIGPLLSGNGLTLYTR